ncbi:Ferric reductase-like transmembrane subunit [Candidatus Koribacter versatilis Ellin345]|uniref:Protein-methionine-sulfoxide reductase heme-binding subunit MsrQ n=1 Tax=Koribacter versatilis (strain Ellin345) TaxID=204669 RepID=Q1ISY9_KORVE|nr:protein-methionine-sulfoxide reductase heme-binding subunit MsrQ [Candidatus Koribacter versatilis]ABF40011.1 Ferric reductase-like transmembrane subunit [Candidatus Koribacter versatilis Ellin345]
MRPKLIKPLVFIACLMPVANMAFGGFRAQLGANPIEAITHETGDWTMILIMTTLAITPLRRITGISELISFRRMIGLFAFFYGTLHFLTYIWLDKFFDMHEIVKDVYKRPFITAGFTAFVLMIPLALTSTKGWIRRLGKKWTALHRLIYGTALAGVVHYIWLTKRDEAKPFMYAVILAALMLWRAWAWWEKRRKVSGARVAEAA